MGATFFTFLALVAISGALDVSETTAETRLPVAQPEHAKDDQTSGQDLLATLQELYNSLVGQIAVLETRQKSAQTDDEMSETSHLIQHYTAQKNNIEHEIASIQSIAAAPPSSSAAVPRHILAHIAPEEKIVPSLLNIFKKPKPSYDLPSGQFAYSAPPAYAPPPYYYPGYVPQFPYPYQGVQPPKPPSYMDTLVQSTFGGYEPPVNTHQQTFVERNRGEPAAEGNSSELQVQPQFTPQPQVSLQGEVPPAPPRADSTYTPQPPSPHTPNGQGVFIYYPNAVVTEDDDDPEPERQTIVDRVGQAFDRFGQVITNLATLRSAPHGSDAHKADAPATRIRVVHRPRSASNRKERTLRWVAV